MSVVEKVKTAVKKASKKTKAKVVEKTMEKLGVKHTCWAVLGFQKPQEFETPDEAEAEVVTQLLTTGETTGAVIVKVVKIDENGKPKKYPDALIHREYNGGVQWVRDSMNPPKEFLT